jgi:hypothetical protein
LECVGFDRERSPSGDARPNDRESGAIAVASRIPSDVNQRHERATTPPDARQTARVAASTAAIPNGLAIAEAAANVGAVRGWKGSLDGASAARFRKA